MRKALYVVGAVVTAAVMLHSTPANAERCSDAEAKMAKIESEYDEVAWGELGSEEFTSLIAALVSSPPANVKDFFLTFRDALGEMVNRLAEEVGEDAAAEILAEVLQSGNTVTFENVTVGRQFWFKKECLPSCANPLLFCLPLPPSVAIYVAWTYDEPQQS